MNLHFTDKQYTENLLLVRQAVVKEILEMIPDNITIEISESKFFQDVNIIHSLLNIKQSIKEKYGSK